MLLILLIVWILNLGISIWNAIAVGNAWVETKHSGGWPRFMAWMGAIMSASGFTWCYLVVLAIAAGAFGWLGLREMEVFLNLGYLLLIPGMIFSGLMITIDSWARAYRERTIANVGVAGYNTFAQIYNTYQAVDSMGDAFKNVGDFFGSDEDSAKAFVIILLLIIAFGLGILTTWIIVARIAANDEPLPVVAQSRRA